MLKKNTRQTSGLVRGAGHSRGASLGKSVHVNTKRDNLERHLIIGGET